MNYFNIFTNAKNAINNINLYGYSELEKTDISRLLGAHLKYSGGYQFINKEDIPEAYGGANSLKNILTALDNLVLYKDVTETTEVFDHEDTLWFDKLYTIAVSDALEYYHIDLSGGDFKSLSKDRTAMLAENKRVGAAMKFLLEHGCEFEYDGSRAKLRMPVNHPANKHLHVGSKLTPEYWDNSKTFLRYDMYKTVTEKKTVAIPKLNY